MEKLIQIKNLTKCFGETKVLDKINVNFDRGHIYGIIGRNGSGKSMLMKCICGLVVPTSGEIIIDNKKLGTDIDLPENLAGIIEEPGFLENYSAYKNLQFLSMIKNKIGKEEIIQTLKSVRLDPYSKLHVGKYSMGMKQRLGLAMAMLGEPELLILDEPSLGLAPVLVKVIFKAIKEISKSGVTVLLVEQNAKAALKLANRGYVLELGKITHSGSSEELLNSEMIQEAYLGKKK